MIQELVNRFMLNKEFVLASLKQGHPSYKSLVKLVVEAVTDDNDYELDPERIHVIDDGDYQGTLLFVIASKGYQPSKYWAVYVGYGSCSGCDTLQGIREESRWDSKEPTDSQVNDYWTLALHIVQRMKEI